MVNRIALGLAEDSKNAPIGLGKNLQRVFVLRRVLREIRPDIALGMMTTANVLLALAALGLSSLCTIGAEHNHPPKHRVGFIWETLRCFTYGLLNAVTALTSETEDWIKHHTNVKRVLVIPNAVPWPLPRQSPRLEPASVGVLGRQRLLAVGRLDRQKGFDWLIVAFAALARSHPQWELVILGEGLLRPSLQTQVDAEDLQQRIFFPGQVGNIGEWYESADLYVMSSRFEGFPNTLAEALAYGLPAVSFDCDTGPRDIVRHEIDGLLVSPGDVAAMTAALDRLMQDADLRYRFAQRAVDARERFSMEKVVAMWEKLFLTVLTEPK